ncbi:MAG: DUF3109 family protein [Mucilaginibacter polytrichastri]|nr:DUF3109 family protein [Mucilaginibacter polytrichastri]
MIEIGNVLVHEDVIASQFVCHLDRCKGACCIEGDAGAPLEASEKAILDEIYPEVRNFMTEKGIRTIEQTGTSVLDEEGDLVTPCVDGNKECAYVTWENGITKCAIEKAWEAGRIGWQKPISCHLYPIRTTVYPEFDVLHYDRWSICSPACAHGEKLGVKVYEFLKAPLARKYGQDWVEQLDEAAKMSGEKA